jgi:hypothetical protein
MLDFGASVFDGTFDVADIAPGLPLLDEFASEMAQMVTYLRITFSVYTFWGVVLNLARRNFSLPPSLRNA